MVFEIKLAAADWDSHLFGFILALDEDLPGLLYEPLVLLAHLPTLRKLPLIIKLHRQGHGRGLDYHILVDVEADLLDFDVVPFFFTVKKQ